MIRKILNYKIYKVETVWDWFFILKELNEEEENVDVFIEKM